MILHTSITDSISLAEFEDIQIDLMSLVSPRARSFVKGTTDTEWFGASPLSSFYHTTTSVEHKIRYSRSVLSQSRFLLNRELAPRFLSPRSTFRSTAHNLHNSCARRKEWRLSFFSHRWIPQLLFCESRHNGRFETHHSPIRLSA